jgi:hypothetical protein
MKELVCVAPITGHLEVWQGCSYNDSWRLISCESLLFFSYFVEGPEYWGREVLGEL